MPVRLFVGGLPHGIQEADLREHFAAVGQPSRVLIPIDRETGAARGFAFVDFDDPAVAEAAIRTLDGQQLGGRSLRISEARPRGERPAFSASGPGGTTETGSTGAAARPGGAGPRRSFGPNAIPRRNGRARRSSFDQAPKGPIRVRSGGRVFDMDDDSPDEAVEVDDVAAGLQPDPDAGQGDE